MTCALAIGFELLFDKFDKVPISPFLPAFGALVLSAAWVGAGPALLATVLLFIWGVSDLASQGVPPTSNFFRSALFLVDGLLLSLGSGRMWRSIKEATRSEKWHRQLVETAAEGIWVHDGQGSITYANARMAQLLGVDQLQGRNVEEFIFPADLSMERVRTANLQDQRKVQFDRRLRRKDGSELWVLACCNLIDSEPSGTGTVSLAMMTDITERKGAETALRRSEERFRNLFEGVLEGVYQSTPEGRILAANPMLLRMLGLTNEAELNDVNIAKDLYVDPGTRRRLLEQLEQEGGIQNAEYELRRRDGEIITVLENARVIRDENGAVLYYEGTLTDITPKKRIEEQLRQAQKVEALGRLAGGVAHDFNNALTIITGFSQLALSELPAAHSARTSMEQVVDAAESALILTKQLLSFSRRQSTPESGIDLNQAVKRVSVAAWKLSLCDEALPVYASPTQIELLAQALSNYIHRTLLCETIDVRTFSAVLDQHFCGGYVGVQPGSYAVLSIGRFATVPSAAQVLSDPSFVVMQPGDSAAMGLSAVQAIMAQCGGFLVRTTGVRTTGVLTTGSREADDRSRDSAFHVFLPSGAFLPVAALPPSGVAQTIPLMRGAEDAAGETILLVEDEPLVRELSRDMLERQGYRVILAANAGEAEQISGSAGSFDLLITDAMMPTISGAELARRLRAQHPGLKVLYISGYADNEAGSDDAGNERASFLQKPFSADSLGRKIRQVLNRG